MSYMHIENLYKCTDILLFKECYALEKIHGTSAHIKWNNKTLTLFSGGSKHQEFELFFNLKQLKDLFLEHFENQTVTIYGEAYGGKCQGMKDTYGDKLKFVVFDILINGCWLDVLGAEGVSRIFGLEFVDYVKIPCDLPNLDFQRDKPSTQAIRNHCGDDKLREGIVIRPLIELTKNNGNRIIAKYKGDKFRETTNVRKVNPDNLELKSNAISIAEEWVTPMRLNHVLDKLGNPTDITLTGIVIKAMIEDITREAKGEIVESPHALKHIGRKTSQLYKERIRMLSNVSES